MSTAAQQTSNKAAIPTPPPTWTTRRFAFLLVGVVALLPYLNSFSVPFVFDDRVTIVNDPAIKDIGQIWRVLLADAAGEIRPLVSLSFAFNYYWGELNVFGYHLVNLLLHAFNGLLVYFIVDRLLKFSPSETFSAKFPTPALLAALFFVAHPVQTEAVTYVWGRSDLLCAFFALLSFFFFIEAQNTQEPVSQKRKAKKSTPQRRIGRATFFYYGAFIFFLLGLGTKATILSFPPLLCAFDYFFVSPRSGERRWRGLLKRQALFFLAAGVRVYLHYSFQKPELIYAFHSLVWDERLDLLSNVLTQSHAIVYYLKLLVFPVGLNIDHDFPVSQSVFDISIIVAFGVLAGLVTLAVFLRQRSRIASFGIVWFLLTLSFYFVFPLPDFLVERRVYLASVGFFTGAVMLLQLLVKRLEAAWQSETLAVIIRFSPLALVVVLAVMTIQRNKVWNDPYALWSEAAVKAPNKARPHSNLAIISLEQQEFNQAVAEAQKALLIDPALAEAHYALLDACMGLGWWGPAIGHFSQTLRTYPYYAVEWYSMRHQELGEKRNLFLRAFSAFEQELTTAPGNADGHISLGFLYASVLGDEQRALAHFKDGLKFPSTRFRRRMMLRIVQDLQKRISHQQRK